MAYRTMGSRVSRASFLRAIGLIGATLALGACGAPPSPTPKPAAPEPVKPAAPATSGQPSTAPAAAPKPVGGSKPKIVYMQYGPSPLSEVRSGHVADYNKSDGLATVEDQIVAHDQLEAKRGAMIAAGTGPDIFHTQGGSQAVATNAAVLLDLDPFINRDKDRFKPEQYYPGIVKYMKYRGKTVIWPSLPVLMVFGYNRKLFDEAGVKHPTNDLTYDEMVAAGQKLTKRDTAGRPLQWGVTINRRDYIEWMQGMWARGGEVLTEDLKKIRLDEKFGVETLQWMFDKVNKHKISPGPGEDIQGDFVSGKFGMDWVTHTSTYADRNKAGLDWDIVMLPKGPVERAPRIAMDCYHLFAPGKFHDPTFDFFSFANSFEQMTKTANANVAPTRKDVAEATWLKGKAGERPKHPQSMENFFDSLQHARHIPPSKYFLKLTLDFVGPQLDAMFEKKKTPEQAARDATKECNDFLAAQTDW